jgi:hypothetical protein
LLWRLLTRQLAAIVLRMRQSNDAQWYMAVNGQQSGPWDDVTFRNMHATGQVPAHASVWCQGMPDWQPVADVLGRGPASPPTLSVAQVWQSPAAQPVRDAAPSGTPGLVTASYVLSGFTFCCCCGCLTGIPAIVCAVVAMQSPYPEHKAKAKVALIVAIVAAVVSTILAVIVQFATFFLPES